ncbi:MAG: hypothetical protein LPJ89_00435 [Hymenobacteraceae bacterium]|nr:hypothetical protein [Hymenobacteraceae bacterium]
MKKTCVVWLLLGSALLLLPQIIFAQKVKTVPFSYLPDDSEDRYHQRIAKKTLPLNEQEFLILSRKGAGEYAVDRYNQDLELKWSAALPLPEGHTLEAFALQPQAALVVTHKKPGSDGLQALFAHQIDINTGKVLQTQKLMEAPGRSRRMNVSISEDGSQIAVYRYTTNNEHQIRAMQAAVYNASLKKQLERTYDFSDIKGYLTPYVHIDNQGDQYVSILSDNATKMTVRRYQNSTDEVKVMTVMVGGLFSGKTIKVFDVQFTLNQEKALFAAMLCVDEQTGNYFSLKAVRFDFEANDMLFAEEFRFTDQYLKDLQKLAANKSETPQRLSDIYLTELVLTPDKDFIVMAERKYTEGGENSPYVARELHLITYDEFLNPAWRSIIMKSQTAPASEAFSGISYRSRLFGSELHILTLETLNNKNDLYLRRINTRTGATSEAPKAIGLNVANDKNIAYVKDFTAWLNEKNIITVIRPVKKSAGLQLSRITIK